MAKPVVPTCSGAEGNTNSSAPSTSKVNPCVRWCFTYNNYTEDTYSSICSTIKEKCRFAIIGKEMSSTGTPHLQGYIEFRKKSRPMSVFKIKALHWEKAKGTKTENIIYCSKEDKKPFYFFGGYSPKITRENFYTWQDDIDAILATNPDDRTIHWYWEPDGCAGKTTFAKWIFCNYPGAVVLSGKGSDMKNGIIQYKATNGLLPRIVLINIPRASQKFVSYSGIEEIKDMFFFSGKYEGGMVCGDNPHVICFANLPPNFEDMSEDRWRVNQISNNTDI